MKLGATARSRVWIIVLCIGFIAAGGTARADLSCPTPPCGDWVCDGLSEQACGCGDCLPEGCALDSCESCFRPPTGEDLDNDAVPDALEYDLAYKYFPSLKLQHRIPDLAQAYVARGLSIPYLVRPLQQGICNEDRECLEIRYGTAYLNDCGDDNILEGGNDSCDGSGAHDGDSEDYAVAVMRATSWDAAAEDPDRWVLIRDGASAHGGRSYRAYGICPDDHCAQYHGNSTCLTDPSCHLLITTGQCVSNIACRSAATQTGHQTLYAAEGKHALYHSIDECNGGGVLGSDDCSENAFDMRDYIGTKLQNIGGLNPADSMDSTILDPLLCGDYDILDNTSFGTVSSYYSKFEPQFPWSLPAHQACSAVQSTADSLFSGAGCTGDEYYASGSTLGQGTTASWDGLGCAAHWPLTTTVVSFRDPEGFCHDAWPAGLVQSDLVLLSRAGLPAPANCSPCEEEICTPATIRDASYHRTSDCSGWEFFDTEGFGSLRASWDGEGCVGTLVAPRTFYSYRDDSGYCRSFASPLYPAETARIYHDPAPPNCAACGESSCSAVNVSGDSYFIGAECTGTEYAAAGGNTNRRSWNGAGCSGNLLQTVAVTTKRDAQGYCWPASSGDRVRVYRTSEPPLPTCSGCGERSCTPVTSTSWSYFTSNNCQGDEYFDIVEGSSTRRSWDGQGCAGDLARPGISIRSYMDWNGDCTNWNGTRSGLSRIYRGGGDDPPPSGCRGCPKVKDIGGVP